MAGKRVVVIGASDDRAKFGNKAVRAYAKRGWEVIPVNPKGGEIEGLRVYSSIRDVPPPIDRVTVYLPPNIGIQVLADIAAANAEEVYFNPGAESEDLIEAAKRYGIDPIVACSIVEIGESPAAHPG